MEYHRPKTIPEAVSLLGRAQPLGGGTALTPRRREIAAVFDVGGLDLSTLQIQGSQVVAGAAVTLQALVEAESTLPSALVAACRQEAGWNLRNAATLGGAIMSGDGRSPFLTVLLALRPSVAFEPGGRQEPLEALLAQRNASIGQRLLTQVTFSLPESLCYEQVARSPADRPLVCLAAARWSAVGEGIESSLTLGGFGAHPIRLTQAEEAARRGDLEAAGQAAQQAFADASDEWASAEYRSQVSRVLLLRVLREVMS